MNRVSGRLASVTGNSVKGLVLEWQYLLLMDYPLVFLVQSTIKQQFNVYFDCSDSCKLQRPCVASRPEKREGPRKHCL